MKRLGAVRCARMDQARRLGDCCGIQQVPVQNVTSNTVFIFGGKGRASTVQRSRDLRQ